MDVGLSCFKPPWVKDIFTFSSKVKTYFFLPQSRRKFSWPTAGRRSMRYPKVTREVLGQAG
jgi:hypothetical protein